MRHVPNTPRHWLRRRAASNADVKPPASLDGMTLSTMLALDGRDVGMILGISHGPEIGAALRWLQAEVEMNPELNTPAALTALLHFAAPLRTFDRTREDERQYRAQRLDGGQAPRSSRRWPLSLGPIATGEVYGLLAIAAPPAVGLGASRIKTTGLSPLWKIELAVTLTMTTRW